MTNIARKKMEKTDVKKPWETPQAPSAALRALAGKPLTGAALVFAENPTEENLKAVVAEREKQRGLN